jgi:type II secretory ATPase GspE/PulE/Tfp pilus assembly ATPase PilB-like protein
LLASLNNSITLEPDGEYYYGTGCNECSNSGMKGRTGIYELLRVTDSLRKMISARPTTEDIVRAAPPDHISMRHDGITKILNGITTPEEVLRVTQSIEE